MGSTVEKILADLQSEAAYFFADDNGNRSGSIVFDLKDTSDIPAIAEPWFSCFQCEGIVPTGDEPAGSCKASRQIRRVQLSFWLAAA